MIRALYNSISNTETWVIHYYSCFSPKTQFTVSLLHLNASWEPNSRFTEPTSTHHHAAHLKLYLLFKITSLYAADYNTDFTIDFTCFTCNTCLLTIPFKNIGGHAAVIGLIWFKCRDATRGTHYVTGPTGKKNNKWTTGIDSGIDKPKRWWFPGFRKSGTVPL